MLLTGANLQQLFTAFNASFKRGLTGAAAASQWDQVATRVPSSTETELYGWLGQIPGMREWIGDRQIKNLATSDYSIRNKSFENTIGVPRTKVEDDTYGIYGPLMEMMGQNALEHRDQLVFALLAAGFSTTCYDGQYFFDTDHPVVNGSGTTTSVSNYQSGSGNPWFLMDTRRPIKPLILQVRKEPQFVAKDRMDDDNVFSRNELLYGVDDRKNVGFGFWQMAFASKSELDAANFEACYDAMGTFKRDNSDTPLGIRPNLLVVGASNASAGRKIVQAQLINGGESNINFNRVQLLEVPWLA